MIVAIIERSYVLGNHLHIPAITHRMANLLAGLYEKDAVFVAFCKSGGLVRQRWVLSKQAKLMPPSMRIKLRFANVFGLILWAKKQLDSWVNLPIEAQNELSFLQENRVFLEEFYVIQSQSLALQKLLKTQAYSEDNHKKVIELLNKNKQKEYAKYAIFKQKTAEYLAVLEAKKPKEVAKIHCSSDNIESAFAKLNRTADAAENKPKIK